MLLGLSVNQTFKLHRTFKMVRIDLENESMTDNRLDSDL